MPVVFVNSSRLRSEMMLRGLVSCDHSGSTNVIVKGATFAFPQVPLDKTTNIRTASAQDLFGYFLVAIGIKVGWPIFSRFGLCMRLAQRRGEVGQDEIGGVNFFGQLAVHFGFFLDTLPFRVILERFPVSGCRFAAGMLQDVHQGVALLRFINGCPVSNALESMPVKKFYGV